MEQLYIYDLRTPVYIKNELNASNKLFCATTQHFGLYGDECVFLCVCFCGVGWRHVWPHGCSSRCDLSLSVKDCSTHPEEEDEENSAAGLRGRRGCCREIETWPPPPSLPHRPQRSLHHPVWHITHSERSELSRDCTVIIWVERGIFKKTRPCLTSLIFSLDPPLDRSIVPPK